MKPVDFDYFRPSSLAACLELLEQRGDDAKVLAGGQSLVPLMNLRLAAPEALIDVNALPDLDHVRELEQHVAVGCLARHRQVVESEVVARRCPLLSRAASLIGYPPIRARGTVGGSLAHADPASELPLIAMTLDAELEIRGPGGPRTVSAQNFFRGFFSTALGPSDMLLEARFPALGPHDGWGFHEFSRKSGDFAVAAVAAVIMTDESSARRVRIGVAGAADRPVRAEQAETALVGADLTSDALADTAQAVADELFSQPQKGDQRFKRQLVATLTERALSDAVMAARVLDE